MVGDVVRALREMRGWNQAELARRAGIPSQHISQIESGKKRNPTHKTLEKLAAAFEMPLAKFVEAIGVGPQIPSALEEMIAEREFVQLSRIWPALTTENRYVLLATAQAMARSRQRAQELEAEDTQEPELIHHLPSNG